MPYVYHEYDASEEMRREVLLRLQQLLAGQRQPGDPLLPYPYAIAHVTLSAGDAAPTGWERCAVIDTLTVRGPITFTLCEREGALSLEWRPT